MTPSSDQHLLEKLTLQGFETILKLRGSHRRSLNITQINLIVTWKEVCISLQVDSQKPTRDHDSALDLAIKMHPGDVLRKGMKAGIVIKDTERTLTGRRAKVNKKPQKFSRSLSN